MTEHNGSCTPDSDTLDHAVGKSRGSSPSKTRERLALPDLRVLERLFSISEDILLAGIFVNIAMKFPEVVRVEAVCGKRDANFTPVIKVIHRGMPDDERDKMVLDLENVQR